MTETQLARFWRHVRPNGNGCLEWHGRVQRDGYGQVHLQGKTLLAHVAAYTAIVGPVPQGLELDHVCRNRRCVNVAHLEPVTHRENVRRGSSPLAARAAQTHCINGHALTGDNLIVRPDGRRNCRTCKNAWERAKYHAQKGANA